MWHNVLTVAQSHFMNPEKVLEVAKHSKNVIVLFDSYLVNTWNCDKFVEECEAAGIERTPQLYINNND